MSVAELRAPARESERAERPRRTRRSGSAIARALAGFEDLPLEQALDLGADVLLNPERDIAVEQAVSTILHNVRVHARASSVFVHADTDGKHWEVMVRDDGVGFEAAGSTGFGLGVQVTKCLADLGVATEIESEPGLGTTVTLRGDVDAQ